MKLVDEKGKLFGKINIIDLVVLVVIIAALAFAALRLRGGDDANPINSTTKLTYTTLVNGVENHIYEEVVRQMEAAGGQDQLMADGKLVDGFVTDVVAIPHVNYGIAADGTMVRSQEDPENGGRWDLLFTVEANVADPTVNKVGTQEVRVFKNHILKTTHFEFQYSTVQSCDWG